MTRTIHTCNSQVFAVHRRQKLAGAYTADTSAAFALLLSLWRVFVDNVKPLFQSLQIPERESRLLVAHD